jgi:hypothetical protein
MFTWICPQCGREVPPAYNECPDCAAKSKEEAPAASVPAAAVPAAPAATPVAKPAPPAAAARPQPLPVQGAPRHNGLNTALLSLVFALAFVGLGAGVYWTVNHFRDRGQSASAQPAAPLENASTKGKAAAAHPLQRYIEVTGVRFLQDAKKNTEVRFLVVNHSPDDIADLGGTVNVWGRTQKSEEEAVGSFIFKLPSIGPYQSKEMAAPVTTKLRVYELPDWQNVTADVQLTSP